MGGSLQFHFFSCNILLKGINSTGLSDKVGVRCSFLTIFDTDYCSVSKVLLSYAVKCNLCS
uniref:Isoform 2 of Pentatricopeptide repeat-containing protein, chloroplastic n=1 Tax=Solanum tuberosum TaxID=4113 RepID=M1AB12_SOLTU